MTGTERSGTAPKVSVLMSLYNKAEHLDEAIQSILAQDLDDFEFIIGDNWSSDDPAAIVNSFDDDRIFFYRNPVHMPVTVSHTLCMSHARGVYIVIAHGDDVWEPDYLSTCAKLMDSHPEINVSYSAMKYIGKENMVCHAYSGKTTVITPEEALPRLFKGSFITTPTVMFRNGTILPLDYRYLYSGDWDLWLRMAAAGYSFLYIDRPLMAYRSGDANQTAIAKRGADLILEGYWVLRNFFKREPRFAHLKGKTFRRFSMGALRMSREIEDRETILFYLKFAALASPLNLLNPVFHLYVVVAFLFGHKGLETMRTITRAVRLKSR